MDLLVRAIRYMEYKNRNIYMHFRKIFRCRWTYVILGTVVAVVLYKTSRPDTKFTKENENCVYFRKTVSKKNATILCESGLSGNGLWNAIREDADEWKRNFFPELIRILVSNIDQMVGIDIGSGTGAITLVNSMFNRKAISVDQYLENLLVLKRALKQWNRAARVKQLWFTVSNTSTLVNERSFSPGMNSKITLDDINKHYLFKDEIVMLWISQGGYELEVLQGGITLFGSSPVCFAVVNFSRQRTRETGTHIFKFMERYSLYPFEDIAGTKPLSAVPSSDGQLSIVFRSKYTTPCVIPEVGSSLDGVGFDFISPGHFAIFLNT